MAEETLERAQGADAVQQGFGAFVAQLSMMFEVLRASVSRAGLLWLDIGLIGVIAATAYWQIELNAWNKPFYDALSRRDLGDFLSQLGVFGKIAGALLVLNVAQTWLNQSLRMKMREAFTRDLSAEWLAPRRIFLLSQSGEIGVNPDQRVHEDARHLADLTTDLGVGLLQAALLLVCFIGVLWGLSAGVTLPIAGRGLVIPGYMVWCALLYASVASAASWLVGRPLIGLNAEHYARESDLRFSLVNLNEHGEDVALCRGEAMELARLDLVLGRLLFILRRLVRATTNLSWVTAGYGWFTIVAPIIVAAPAYFEGDLTLGGLLMSAGAFTQVQQSLRWFVDNAGALADWRATLHRVAAFRMALLKTDGSEPGPGRIAVEAAKDDRLRIENLEVFLPYGTITLSKSVVELAPGERMLIVGAPGAGKTSLFRALAGLWPWGSGRIAFPRSGSVMFVPKRPYLPDGSLREALAYPAPVEKFSQEAYERSLMRLGLGRLSPDLDRRSRWEQELTDPEQQALAFARLRLHEPSWVVIDEALESIGPEAREAVFDLLARELSHTAVLCIGGPQARHERGAKVLAINFEPGEPRLA
jgi:vitamin B12/bleomycin/antimicrobial peptide transport system ATP-binding/permease protein